MTTCSAEVAGGHDEGAGGCLLCPAQANLVGGSSTRRQQVAGRGGEAGLAGWQLQGKFTDFFCQEKVPARTLGTNTGRAVEKN